MITRLFFKNLAIRVKESFRIDDLIGLVLALIKIEENKDENDLVFAFLKFKKAAARE